MQVHEGERVKFTYTDVQGNTEHWEGTVTTAKEGGDWFRMATGEPHPRTFRYERVQGEIKVLAPA
jgi:hypothetical protein